MSTHGTQLGNNVKPSEMTCSWSTRTSEKKGSDETSKFQHSSSKFLVLRLKQAMKADNKNWKSVENTVGKDVVRTDRRNPFYKGDNNPNIEIMRYLIIFHSFRAAFIVSSSSSLETFYSTTPRSCRP